MTMTTEWEEISKELLKGNLPEFDEARRPNKIKKVPTQHVCEAQQKAIKR